MEFLDQIPQWVILAAAAVATAFGLQSRLPWLWSLIVSRLKPDVAADTRPDAFQALTVLMAHVKQIECPKIRAECEASFETLAKAVIRPPGYKPDP